MPMHTNSDEGNGEKGVFSLFDQRVKNQAKRKKSSKSTTASKKSAVKGTNSHTNGGKGSKKNVAIESDGEQDQENESDEDGRFIVFKYIC